MNVEISRNELAGALSALGKLVCRTSPLEAYRSLRIEGKENQISFQTAGLDESITCTVPVEGGAEFCVFVNFDNFRTVAKFSRNKSLVVEYEQGKFAVDHCLLPTVNVEWPKIASPTGDAVTTELPENLTGWTPTGYAEYNLMAFLRLPSGWYFRLLQVAFAVEILNSVKFLKNQHEPIISNQIGGGKGVATLGVVVHHIEVKRIIENT